MFPLRTTNPYPYEQWWLAGHSREVGFEILGRDILGKPVILYRTAGGEAVALHGICPHRSYPLAKSRLVGDDVQCGYHGLKFDKSGACIEIPSQETVAIQCRIHSYPVVERDGLVWIWTGAAAMANPSLVPDLSIYGLGRPDWETSNSGPYSVNARYTLLIDNLMDLSHIAFVHEKTIPIGRAAAAAPVEIIEGAGTINAQRVVKGIPQNPLFQAYFPNDPGPFSSVIDSLYLSPALIKTGGPLLSETTGQELGQQNFLHFITPADKHRLHYVVVESRNIGVGDPRASAGSMGDPGAEDVETIEAVELMLQRQNDTPVEVSCRVDGGAIKVRRLLAAQIRREEAAEGQGSAPSRLGAAE